MDFLGGRAKEVPSEPLPLEIRDQDLTVAAAGSLLSGVGELDALNEEAAEEVADLGNVVQRQDELAVKLSETFCEFLEVCRCEIVAVEVSAEIRGIQVKKGGRTVVPPKDFFIRQAFDLHSFQSLMGIFKELGKTLEVESRRLDHVPVVIRMADKARK